MLSRINNSFTDPHVSHRKDLYFSLCCSVSVKTFQGTLSPREKFSAVVPWNGDSG